jgi:hypothetical protein
MKTTIKLLVVFALALTTFLQHSVASAATVFRFQGNSVVAYFTRFDGCIFTQVTIIASERRVRYSAGRPITDAQAVLIIIQEDLCTGAVLLAAEGRVSLSVEDLEVSNLLKSATLNTIIPVYDYRSDTTFDIFVNLTWTGDEILSRESFTNHVNRPGCKINGKSIDSLRYGEASGVISDGTTNFIPKPTTLAWLVSARSGIVTIGCD